MKRFSAALAVSLAAACSGSETPATIQLFVAQPSAIALGGTTTLVIAAAPFDATLTIDNGVGDVTGKTSVTVSPAADTTYTLTATRKGSTPVTLKTSVSVGASPSTAFKVEATSAALVVAGAPAGYLVSALGPSGAVNPNYRGTVHFSSTDLIAALPADLTFSAADAGKHAVTATFKTAGDRALFATDLAVPSAQGLARVTVSPGAATSLVLFGVPDSPTAGDRLALTVTAFDVYGNVATGYAGKVHFTSGDATAQLPADFTYGAADRGTHPFGAAFTKAAFSSIAVADTGGVVAGSGGAMSIKHAAAARVTLEGVPAAVTVDTTVTVTVTVRDAFANPVTDYAGTLRFMLTDGAAAGIPDAVFTAAMHGTTNVTTQFATASDQSISATDLASSSITGSAATKVNHGQAVGYALSGMASASVAGEPLTLTIRAVDAHGNTVKNYAGVAHVSSGDSTDRLPSDGGFSSGSRSVSVAYVTAGTHTVTVSEVGGTITATTGSTAVSAADARTLTVTGGSAIAGAATSTTVTAKDAFGNTADSFAGTVTLTSSDAQATLPAPHTLTAGVFSFSITLSTAGAQTVTATAASVSGRGSFAVSAAGGATLVLGGLPGSATAGDRLAITVTVRDAFGNLATSYTGSVHFTSSDTTGQLPADYAFVAADQGVHAFGATFTKVATTTLSVAGTGVSGATGSLVVGHAAAARVTLEGVPANVTVDTDVVVTVTVRDTFANPITDYAGTLHFVLTDGAAPTLPDLSFNATLHGTADVTVRFATAGDQSIIASDVALATLTGSTATHVNHGGATAYLLSALPTGAGAGEPLPLSIRAVDAHGNVVTNYAGTAHVSSADSTDRLPADGGFTGGFREVSLAYLTSGTHSATVSEVGGTITATTTSTLVSAGDATVLALTGGSITAGTATSTTVTARDAFGNTVASFAGTVTLTTSDAQATPPAPHTLTAGVFTFPITLLTSGVQTVTATSGSVTGSGSFTVGAAGGTNCLVTDTPASAAAGSQVGLRVVVKDAYANVATGYAGTMAITSSDASAQLPANGTFSSSDGTRAFSVQLRTSGNQLVIATDTVTSSIACSATVNVLQGATVLVVAFTGLDANLDAWAGTPVAGTVTAQDAFGNRISNYGGTVAFTSSDAAAVKPGNAVFGPSDNGQKAFSVTFNTVGAQTLTATDTSTAAIQGTSKAASVHGLVYTNPATGGKVRLIQNAVSSASVVQLDLVSNASLFALSAGTSDTLRNGVFAAGMNLPLDTTKVGPDAQLLVTTAPAGSTAVLNLGTGPQAKGAAINATNGVLYSGISQKRVDATAGAAAFNNRGDVSVRPYPNGPTGTGSYYYSVRLALTPGAAVGTVFDGQALSTKFHAAVRDRSGSDVFAGPDFAIGKLEIR